MREQLINLIKALRNVSLTVTQELPFSNSGTPLYLKNSKVIYVDNPRIDMVTLIPVLNGDDLIAEQTRISLYFSQDAKKPLKDYLDMIVDLRLLKDQFIEYYKKECTSTISYDNDLMITTVEYTFTQIKGN
jgi:hypothetical protein